MAPGGIPSLNPPPADPFATRYCTPPVVSAREATIAALASGHASAAAILLDVAISRSKIIVDRGFLTQIAVKSLWHNLCSSLRTLDALIAKVGGPAVRKSHSPSRQKLDRILGEIQTSWSEAERSRRRRMAQRRQRLLTRLVVTSGCGLDHCNPVSVG